MKQEDNQEDFSAEESGEAEGELAVDLYQTDDELVIQSTIAGVLLDDLEINISAEKVNIKGKRKREEIIEEGDFFCKECFWGIFSRSIILPQEVNPDHSAAFFKDGVLTIRMPKIEHKKIKKIKIKID